MKRSLTYKLAILGCMSSCFMSLAAYAQVQMDDENVQFTSLPDITNVACGADSREYIYEVTNTTNEIAEIESFEIVILPEDTVRSPSVVTFFQPTYVDEVSCTQHHHLLAGESCVIGVSVNPWQLDCPSHDLITDGEIERLLVLELDSGSQWTLSSPIDFDVTILGSAQDYALLSKLIHIDGDEDGEFSVTGSQVQVAQNVGAANDVIDYDDIIFLNDEAHLYIGSDPIYAPENAAAFSDAQAAYFALRSAAFDARDEYCSAAKLDLLGDRVPVNPGIYCLIDGDDNDDYAINGRLVFQGNEDSIFVFYMPAFIDHDNDDRVKLEIESTTSYQLLSPAGLVNPDNIIWVGADEIDLSPGANIPGTFLTRGEIEGLSSVSASTTQPEGAAMITGRLLSFPCSGCGGDVDTVPAPPQSIITLNGNSILKPW